jgi:outer membrane protein OmpA-like peptidoglycan-associated protein
MIRRTASVCAVVALLLSPTDLSALENGVVRLVPRQVGLVARTVRGGATTTETARRIEIVIPTHALFGPARTAPVRRARRTLRNVAHQIRSEAKGIVRIEGHTGPGIADAATVALLNRRVTVVRRALVGFLPSGVSFRSPVLGIGGGGTARSRGATPDGDGTIVIGFPK